jgi:histidinol-phosphate aminotransferase
MPALSRRAFAQLLGTAAAAATLPIPLAAAPARSVVRLSANENPWGPSPAALQSMRDGFTAACRYPDEAAEALIADLAKLHGVAASQILIGAGSGEILRLAALAFTGPQRALVTADPTFEALGRHSTSVGAEVRRVPLTATHEHDIGGMIEKSPGAGLVYVCNPNNPTATITPARKIAALITSVPEDMFVLVDEAYHHYVASPDYASVLEDPKRRRNVIALRTFSKVYGMAGLRCGYAVADQAAIAAMGKHQPYDTVNVLAAVAARSALREPQHVAEHRKRNAETRSWLVDQMRAVGHGVLPSHANFVMIDTGRDVRPLIRAMAERGVEVGRLFPAMPQHLRVTVGKPEEMKRFVEVFRAVTTAG